MRLYLSADIEGTCGIADWAETERATMDDYKMCIRDSGGTGERQYRLQGMRAEGSTATKALGLNDSAPHR